MDEAGSRLRMQVDSKPEELDELDRRLLERTVELAKTTKAFDWKKLPKSLRIGVDSRPLEGAGRVEDTINLLGHAGRKIAECMAAVLGANTDEICQQAGAPLLTSTSIKAGLDIDWNDGEQKAEALNRLCRQLDRLTTWVEKRKPQEAVSEPLTRYIEALAQVKKQDLETGETGGARIRQGVAEDEARSGPIGMGWKTTPGPTSRAMVCTISASSMR